MYTDVATIRALLPKLTVLVMPDAGVQAFITKADALINSKIGTHYILPLVSTPAIIASMSADIACFYITRTQFTQDSQNKSKWSDEYKEAIKMLDDCAGGNMILLDPATNSPMPNITGLLNSNTKGYVPVFDVGPAEDQVVDPAQLSDLTDERST